ncbi:MAG: Ig-like domain-containing protein [Polyangiales bacterium]
MTSRWLAYSSAFLALMALGAACKGGGGPEVTFLEVLETSPVEGSASVQVETRIGFRINAPIDPATLTGDNFFVTDSDGTPVQGALAIDEPDTAVLTPDEPLNVLTTYTATITTGLSSPGGAMLEQDYDWQFTTLDSAWGVSEWLEQVSTGLSSRPQVAVDAQSNALAAWEYEVVDGTGIWANRYTRVDLWGEPEQIDDGSGGAAKPRLAADDAGNGFVVWEQTTPGTSIVNIWTNRYTVGEGWGTPALLQNGEVTQARSPAVAADPAGNAIAVWVQREMSGTNQVVWAIRYEPGTGWGTAAPIDDMPTPTAGEVTAVGMDDDGNAIAVWARPTVPTAGGRSEVLWANRYTAGLGWETATLIKPDSETRALDQRLSVGAGGDAFVVWTQNDPLRGDIADVWGVRFSGATWGEPDRIDDYDDADKLLPDIAVDGSGIAHAVWSQTDPDFQNIWANQYTPGSGWGTPELIEPPNIDPLEDADATEPRIAVNAAGNAFVVWRQTWQDWGSIWSNRLDPGTGWMNAELIEQIERAAKSPRIAVDDRRHAQAVWLHARDTGIDWVRTNRFE